MGSALCVSKGTTNINTVGVISPSASTDEGRGAGLESSSHSPSRRLEGILGYPTSGSSNRIMQDQTINTVTGPNNLVQVQLSNARTHQVPSSLQNDIVPGALLSSEGVTQNLNDNFNESLRWYSGEDKTDLPQRALSPRAQETVHEVNEIFRRCGGEEPLRPGEPPVTQEEQNMFIIFCSLLHSPIGRFFVSHPEVTLSNRCCVITAPDFSVDEVVEQFRVKYVFLPGTVGRSYFAIRDKNLDDPTSYEATGSRPGSSRGRKGGMLDNVTVATVKAVSFTLRKVNLEEIIAEQRVLVNLNHENVLKIYDVLNDDFHENMIVISEFIKNGNISPLAGKFDESGELLRKILIDVTEGLRVLHTHDIYHHNLKLENVFHQDSDTYCIADAGFSRIFTSQCPEQLVFNGELACIPPEVFDENSRYALTDAMLLERENSRSKTAHSSVVLGGENPSGNQGKELTDTLSKVDVWGLGILMYRLAYGKSPLTIGECTFEEARERILNFKLEFPKKEWAFASDLEDAISWCVEKDPNKRPSILKLLKHPFFNVANNVFTMHQSGHLPSARSNSFFVSSSNLGPKRKNSKNGYSFEKHLGKGRWSETLLTKQRGTSDYFAFKIIRKSLHSRLEHLTEKQAKELKRRIAICRKIKHPNLVKYVDIIDGVKGCFVVEEYIETDRIKTFPNALNDSENKYNLLFLLFQVLSGLYALHSNGVPHLSLTPHNIFFDDAQGDYKLSDFGPLFISEREINETRTLYTLPSWIKEKDLVKGADIDTFCVGLLAVSPYVEDAEELWNQFMSGKGEMDTKGLLQSTESASEHHMYKDFRDFTETCLTKEVSVRKLLKHPLFSPFRFKNTDQKIELSENEIDAAIGASKNNRPRVESRIMDIVGHGPGLESILVDDDDNNSNDISISCFERQRRFQEFTGKNIICNQCKSEMPYVMYCCLECTDFVRCGKCYVNNDHKHELIPYYVHSVTHLDSGKSRAVLVPITTLRDQHAVETLEMNANFPAGVLTEYWKMGSTGYLGKTVVSLGFDSDDDESASCSPCSSNALIESTLHFGTRIQSIDGLSPKSSHLNNSVSALNLPSLPGNKNNLVMRFKSGRSDVKSFKKNKLTLPKEGEIDDMTVEQSIEVCREENYADLILINKGLVKVPEDIYNPPLLNISHLSLSRNELVSLPHQIGLLKNLKELIVSENKLDHVPESIGNLLLLERFDASHNLLTDLPQNFTYLSNLETISLDSNQFYEFPQVLFNITTSEISLAEIERTLDGTSPDEEVLGMLPLKYIYITANDNITAFPDVKKMKRFGKLVLCLDNVPSIYTFYNRNKLNEQLPNVTVNWNKRYPDEIIENLYCGALRSAQSQFVYEKLNIKYLLTVGRDLTPTPPEGGKHLVIVVDDIPGADIRSSFQEAVDFIDESLRRNLGCLVHCFAGMSRSATTVIAYLMMKKKMRMDDAYLTTKAGRPAINPNKSFVEQLIQLDAELFGKDARPLNLAALGRGDDTEDALKEEFDNKEASKRKKKKESVLNGEHGEKKSLTTKSSKLANSRQPSLAKEKEDEGSGSSSKENVLRKTESIKAADMLPRLKTSTSSHARIKEEASKEGDTRDSISSEMVKSLPPAPVRNSNNVITRGTSERGIVTDEPTAKKKLSKMKIETKPTSPRPSADNSVESIVMPVKNENELAFTVAKTEDSIVMPVTGENDLDFSSIKPVEKPTSAPTKRKNEVAKKKFVPKLKNLTPVKVIPESETSIVPNVG